jgi:hypothetical protein
MGHRGHLRVVGDFLASLAGRSLIREVASGAWRVGSQ